MTGPMLLFSHGLGCTRAGSVFLGDHWAARCYVAVFLQHPGSEDTLWKDEALIGHADLKSRLSVYPALRGLHPSTLRPNSASRARVDA